MVDEVELAEILHGHLSPGVALGVRMGQIGLKKVGLSRGDKRLFAVVETALCLADGIQASTGCTVGHSSLRVEDFGKLAACIFRSDTKEGIRLSLKIGSLPPALRDWVMRKRKFSREEEEKIVKEILHLDEASFNIEYVTAEPFSKFEEAAIVKCEACGELIIETKAIKVEGRTLCRACHGERYYRPHKT
ncbi:MAG: FmdE family protein [Candidatus Bathyarchaeia archaeon]|nr:TraR/DksA C4-type zinc finger protein [Candidatus Bathyarchaeota archaeon]